MPYLDAGFSDRAAISVSKDNPKLSVFSVQIATGGEPQRVTASLTSCLSASRLPVRYLACRAREALPA